MRSLTPYLVSSTGEPWFRRRPRWALVVIVAMYVAVLCLRLLAGSPIDAFSMLYVLPVALAATTFGRRGGLVAGLVAVALIAAWVAVRHVHLAPMGWASRVVPILLLGYLLGGAVDRLIRAEEDRRRMERAALLHREAIEINDSLIQQMTAARWALEGGRTEVGQQILTAAVTDAQRLVSGLIRRADMGERSELGPQENGEGRRDESRRTLVPQPPEGARPA
jgi:glucose-6-phosphate-specific signal transduction histidine kinase